MNKMEDSIRRQREALDSFEPPAGHMERFSLRLGGQTFIYRIPRAVRIAALLCLVAASSILLYEQLDSPGAGSVSEMNSAMKELTDAKFYYTSLIQEKYRAIDDFTSDDPEHNRILMTELEGMDRMFTALQEDLQTSPSDERIVHAMISHYELKLDVMSQILQQLENVKQVTNNNSDEDTEV